ncbi:hypothetical protein BD410DRAFT_737560 [Rickenella mellea]|uniref:CoA-dependent acyltransferase n=1 Tax=Rickenella mellea TaxID=50990 RepID=A0A4Y7QLU3_9AGAM|nr:hypothetical protein BD410DRAFT_737560 [Rickenella mellea]
MAFTAPAKILATEFTPPPSPPLSENTEACDSVSAVQHAPTKSVSERRMGETELSFYLPSRADGVNDMYLHLGFRAPERLVDPARVCAVWALLRLRHPLLASTVRMSDYDDVRFVYQPPESPESSLKDADRNLEFRTQSSHDLIDTYLNGTRTLSNERLSYLIVAHSKQSSGLETPLPTPDLAKTLNVLFEGESIVNEHDLLICAAHFIGDGMALHNFANEFFSTLSSDRSTKDIEDILHTEWEKKWGIDVEPRNILPPALEDNLPALQGKFRRAACDVDYQNANDKLIGGHAFPRKRRGSRHTIVTRVPFDEKRTKQALQKCKSQGVSIANVLFAVCDIAWTRMSSSDPKLPIMFYSALNLRPYLFPSAERSYWFLGVGFFNVILPNFLPKQGDVASTFWHRAKEAKRQCSNAVKNPLLIPRAQLKAEERGKQARIWAKEDDERERGIWQAPPQAPPKPAVAEKAPSTALLGLSMLGNLDGIYKHSAFGNIKLHTLTTGSRQRSNAMLLFGYTFASKLWLSLGYDENGLDRDAVEQFWCEVLKGVDEFLLH